MYLHQEVFVGGVRTKIFRIVTVSSPFILSEPTPLKLKIHLGWREKFGKLHDVLYVYYVQVPVWSYQFH